MSKPDDPPFQLPYRLELFGGRDATKAAFAEGELKTQLFDFGPREGRTYRKVTLVYDILGERIVQDFSVPQGVAFDLAGGTTYRSVTEMGLSGSATYAGIGFGLEVTDSSGEKTLEESYQKYVSSYQRTATYNFHFVDESPGSVKTWLSDLAIGIFAKKDAYQIVESFGTHYMTEATFGGVQRMSSRCKIMDSTVTTNLSSAFEFKLEAEGESAGGEAKGHVQDASEITRKIYNSLTDYRKDTFGGLPEDKSVPWDKTLLENPIVIGNVIKTMDELIIDDPELKAAVKKEIDDRMKATLVTTKLAVAYYADFGGATNDAGSKAKDDISAAAPNDREGWWSVGQYAVPSSKWDTKGKGGLMIRADDSNLVLAPTGAIRRFGMRSPTRCGLFAMACPGPAADGSQYQALTDHFAREDNPDNISFDNAGCVNTKLLVKAKYGKQIWADHGSGAHDSGSVWAVVDKDALGPVEPTAPQLFKAFDNYDGPNGHDVPEVWVPNWEKIALIDPLFLDGVSGVIV